MSYTLGQLLQPLEKFVDEIKNTIYPKKDQIDDIQRTYEVLLQETVSLREQVNAKSEVAKVAFDNHEKTIESNPQNLDVMLSIGQKELSVFLIFYDLIDHRI